MDDSLDLRARLDALKGLNRRRFDYVLARARLPSIAAAIDEIGLSHAWYYKFSEEERKQLEDLSDELHYETAIQAAMILEQHAAEAAIVKVEGLKSKNPRIQQDAATEVLDRVGGRPTQRQEVDLTSAGKQIKAYIGISPDDWDSDAQNE